MVLSLRSWALTALMGLVPVAGAFAQCTPSTSACAFNPQQYFGSVCFTPNPLPDGTVNVPYNEAIRFVAAQSITQPLPLTLNKIEVLKVEYYLANGSKVDGSVVGLTTTLTSGNPVDNPNIATNKAFTPVAGNGFGPFGCIQISGTPTQEIDSLALAIRINDAIEIPGPVSQTPINLDFRVNPASTCNLNVSTATVASACNSPTGSITVTASNGTPPYQYRNGGTGSFQSSNIFNNVEVGTYVIFVKDANGCETTTGPVTVPPQSAPPVFTLNVTRPNCFGEKGSVQIAASGGTPPYKYSLNDDPFQVSDQFSNLGAGDYTAYVEDANGCVAEGQSFSIPNIAELTASIAQTTAGCSGSQRNVVVSASGGTAPYTYSSDGTTFQSSNTLACLAAGTYTITVKDANDCTNATSVTISGGTSVGARLYTAVRVYPNPVAGSRFQVELTGVSVREARLSLTDAQGRVVWSQTATTAAGVISAEVPATGLAAGVYTLTSPAIGLNHKVVVQ